MRQWRRRSAMQRGWMPLAGVPPPRPPARCWVPNEPVRPTLCSCPPQGKQQILAYCGCPQSVLQVGHLLVRLSSCPRLQSYCMCPQGRRGSRCRAGGPGAAGCNAAAALRGPAGRGRTDQLQLFSFEHMSICQGACCQANSMLACGSFCRCHHSNVHLLARVHALCCRCHRAPHVACGAAAEHTSALCCSWQGPRLVLRCPSRTCAMRWRRRCGSCCAKWRPTTRCSAYRLTSTDKTKHICRWRCQWKRPSVAGPCCRQHHT